MKFVVYLTIYDGDELPPMYIGSTSMKSYLNGYTGSVSSKLYKAKYLEIKDSFPDRFDAIVLDTANTREEALSIERFWQKRVNAHKNELFMNMAIAAPNGFFGRDVSGKNHPLYGSNNCEGNIHSYNPSTGETIFKPNIPEGFIRGRNPKNYKASSHNKGKLWYNNGTDKKLFYPGQQPTGWIKGSFNTESQRINIKRSRATMSIENKLKISVAVSKAKRGPLFAFYDELYKLWVSSDRVSPEKFRPIAIKNGYPDLSYHSLIYAKFKVQYENSIIG